MEVVGSALGVLASVEQVITTVEALRDRYVAFRQNPEHVSRLLTSYQSFATHLHAMDDQFRGKLCNLPAPNKAIFERHIREMVDSFDAARNTLDQLLYKLSRGRLMRFLRAKVQSDACDDLLSELRRVEGLLFDINSFLATADVIESVKEDIRAGGETDQFRPSFPAITGSPDLVLNFDAVDGDGYPNTVEATVKKLILDREDGNGVVSLQGMGGVGKSSVLRQLALDMDIRKQFSDGIHLITLGVDATHSTATRELLNAVSDSGGVALAKKLQSETALDAVIRGVVKWFQSRKCLFLIDDLWSANRLGASFLAQIVGLIGNEHQGRVLVTTRDLEIASYGHIVAMKPPDALSDQSKAIMMRYAKAKYEDITDEKTKSNIEELLRISGGLPVTLAIVGKGVNMLSVSYNGRKKIAWQNYLRTLRACREDLMSRNVGDYSNLAATFSASISLLEERRHTMPVLTAKSFAQMHKALCVLKKQGSAPMPMLRLLWNLENEQNAAFIAREFARVGLAEISLENICNEYHEFLHLHDVIHDFAVSRSKPHISAAHDDLLSSYVVNEEVVPPADDSAIAWWSASLKPDGYIHTNLCRHLRLAERETELLDLLCRPEWLKRQFTLNNTNQVEDDLFEGITVVLRKLDSEELCVTERDLKNIAGAVRLSSTFLSHNPSELCFQLFARLTSKESSSAFLREYLKKVEDMAETPWLKPLDECLATSGGPLKSIIKVDNPLTCLCMSIDRKQALCGSDDGCVYVISLEGGVQPLSKWKAHDATVTSLSISSDGCKLVTGSWDCTSKVWDLRTRSCVAVFSLHQGFVNGVELAPDDETVVSASQDDTVKVWKITDPEKELFSFKNHYGWVFAVALSPDGRFAFSGGDDEAVLAWSIHEAGRIFKRFARHKKWVKCLKVSNDGALLASGSGSVVRIWDLVASSKDPLKELEASTGSVRALAMSPDGSRVVAGYDDNSVRVWDVEVGEQVGGDLISHSDSVMGVSLSPDGNTATSCSWDGSLRVWDLTDLQTWRPRRNAHEEGVTCLSLTPDGGQLVSGSKDRSIKVWDVSSGRQTAEEYLRAHEDDISGVAVTPDGQRLVSTSLDKTLRIRDRQTQREVAQMTGHERNISCLAISEDGMEAYTGSHDLTVRIWDLAKCDGSHVILSGHTHWIRKLFLSEDGRRIISVSWVEVRVWEIEQRECVRFVHLEDAHLLSQADLFATVGEEWRRRLNIEIPLQGRQIVWKGEDDKTVLGTLEADVVDWCFSKPLNIVCVGLSSGQIAFFRLKT